MIETNQFIDFQIGHEWESFQIFGELDKDHKSSLISVENIVNEKLKK